MLKKPITIFVLSMLLLVSTMLMSYELSTKGSPKTNLPNDIPVLYVHPQNITDVNPGEQFTVSIKIFNLTGLLAYGCKDWQWGCPLEKGGISLTYNLGDLYGLDINFTWNPSILGYNYHNVTIPVDDYPSGVLYEPTLEISDTVDESAGTYHIAYASMSPAPVFNGSGTVFNITFTVLKHGTCFLHFDNSKLTPQKMAGDPWLSLMPHHVMDGYFGRDIEVSRVEVQKRIAQGYPVKTNVTVSNLGGGTENFTLAAYYNTTVNGGWKPLRLQPIPEPPLAINEINVTNMPGTTYHYGCNDGPEGFATSKQTLQFWWNTTHVPKGYYRIKVNTTGIPNEENVTNNVLYSADHIQVTKKSHDMLIETLGITAQTTNPRTTEHFEYLPPLISGETAKLNFTVLNDGTIPETGFNVTLYTVHPNGTTEILFSQHNLTQGANIRKVFTVSEWDTTGLIGEYIVGANVSKVNETLTGNNQKEERFWIVTPPNLNFTYSQRTVSVGDTLFFNATISNHTMPDGYMTHWKWKIYKEGPNLIPENVMYHYDGGPTMNYTFNEWSSSWPVILNVTDNYGLFYMGYNRPLTGGYKFRVDMAMKPRAEEPTGWPPLYTYLIVLAIVIIITLAVYLTKIRKT